MLLFLPFRKASDLVRNGSHQLAFQEAYREDALDSCFAVIAPNIQTIHNSVESGIPQNSLTADTVLVEPDDFRGDSQVDNSDFMIEDVMEGVSEICGDNDGEQLIADSRVLNPSFRGECMQEHYLQPPASDFKELKSVIEVQNDGADQSKITADSSDTGKGLFTTSISELNSLAMHQVVVFADPDGQSDHVFSKATVAATGSWQSIIAWGLKEQLDTEQQTAFEILAATYVLTFYEGATYQNGEEDASYLENITQLCVLARRKMTEPTPLRMFITGPAGAGKCKLLRVAFALDD